MLLRKIVAQLTPDDVTGLFRDILFYVLPGVLFIAVFHLWIGQVLNNGLNDWAMKNLGWWTALQRLFFVAEVYLIFVPAILVGIVHYLRVEGLRLTVWQIFFDRRTPVLVILLAFVFFSLSVVDLRLSALTRPLVKVFGEPVVQTLFTPDERQGFWFNLVRGMFVTLASVLAIVPAIYLFARFSFGLLRYVSPEISANASSWSLTSGMVGVRLLALLALLPFLRFVLSEIASTLRDLYLPIQNPGLLWAVIYADSVLLKFAQVVFLVGIGAIVAIVYRQAAPGFENPQVENE